jgi:flagellar hook assembly protein FlgD
MTSTYTPTRTQTDTPTYTVTVSPTFTCTPSTSPTPVPYPYILVIGVYNSAGEKVSTIGNSPVTNNIGDIIMSVSGTASAVYDPNEGNLLITLPGVQSSLQPANGTGAVFTWNGDTSAGQQVSSGIYYIKFTMQDSFGSVETIVKEVQIIKSDAYTRISIYNSAGELVQRINLPTTATSAISLAVDDVVTVGKGSPDVQIGYATGDVASWDGTNSDGRIVDSGIYEVKVETVNGDGIDVVASKSISVLNGGAASILSNIEIIPNPLTVTDPSQSMQIKWQASIPGKIDIQINNLSGELVAHINATLQSGSAYWNLQTQDGQSAASGLYVLILRAVGDTGGIEIKVVKAVVVKK